MKTILKAMFLLCVTGLPLSTIHAQKKEIIDNGNLFLFCLSPKKVDALFQIKTLFS